METRVTVKDIAQRLQIAPGTVSRALNNKPGISKEMRRRVNEVAEEMGYVANRLAKGLSSKPVTIGVLMPTLRKEFFQVIRNGIEKALESYRDYRIKTVYRLVSHLFDREELTARVNELIHAGIDVALVTTMPSQEFRDCLNLFTEHGVGVVLMGDSVPDFHPISCNSINYHP